MYRHVKGNVPEVGSNDITNNPGMVLACCFVFFLSLKALFIITYIQSDSYFLHFQLCTCLLQLQLCLWYSFYQFTLHSLFPVHISCVILIVMYLFAKFTSQSVVIRCSSAVCSSQVVSILPSSLLVYLYPKIVLVLWHVILLPDFVIL